MSIVRFLTRMMSDPRCRVWALTLFSTCLLLNSHVVAQDGSPANDESEQSAGSDDDAAKPDAEVKSDVLMWVGELDASSLSKRRAAEKALIEIGPAALQFLPETRDGFSLEASQRLTRVRAALQAIRTKEETRADSIVVRLDKASTLGEALEAISLESQVEFEYQADESLPIKPTQTPLSFWHAVDYVLDQTDLDINFYGGDEGTLMLVQREEGRPSRVESAAYAGVYRIEPTQATSRRNLRNPATSGLNVNVEISWEPRLTPIGLTIPIDELTGKLDDGATLEPQASGDNIEISTNADIAFSEFFLPLNLPAGKPRKIDSLSGNIRALLPGKRQTFELALGQANDKKTIDSMTVEIETVRKNGPLHEIRVAIQLDDPGRALESHRQWIFENDAFVRRKDGSRADHLTIEVFRQSESSVGVGYLFDLGDDINESTFIYKSATAVVPNEVPFIIQDIPLP